jgi:alanine racemase
MREDNAREQSTLMQRRVQLEVDLAILRENFQCLAALVAPCAVMVVLKANAYGLGVRPIAEALLKAGAARFAVAEPNEALGLMDLGLPVHILGGVLPDEIPDAVRHGLVLPLSDLDSARRIDGESALQGRRTRVHVLVDTGMGRLGVLLHDAAGLIRAAAAMPHLDLEGIYTHFPVAYRSGSDFTHTQIAAIRGLISEMECEGVRFPLRHAANSDAIHNFRETYQPPFNMVRTGINLYGCFDMEGHRLLPLKSVLTLKTRLTAVRELPAGMNVGYGCTFTTPRAMRVGTISAGYADGLPLALSNRGHVLIHGHPCPVLGRVSMDYTAVDLTQAQDAQCGDEVVCLGGEGPCRISVDSWAQLKSTHPYDIICSIGGRVQRVYTQK